MKDGTIINVDDMTEAHAKNCLKLMLRRSNEAENVINSSIKAEFRELIRQETAPQWDADAEDEFWSDEYRYGKGS